MNPLFLMVTTAMAATLSSSACTPAQPNPLDKLGTVRMTIADTKFELWIADSSEEQTRGLMFITKEQMAPLPDGTKRGMIFIFPTSIRAAFWMKNTIIPLDIAYVTTDMKVVKTYTMTPLDERFNQYAPGAPYRFAIELNAGVLSELGVKEGDTITIPDTVLKRRP